MSLQPEVAMGGSREQALKRMAEKNGINITTNEASSLLSQGITPTTVNSNPELITQKLSEIRGSAPSYSGGASSAPSTESYPPSESAPRSPGSTRSTSSAFGSVPPSPARSESIARMMRDSSPPDIPQSAEEDAVKVEAMTMIMEAYNRYGVTPPSPFPEDMIHDVMKKISKLKTKNKKLKISDLKSIISEHDDNFDVDSDRSRSPSPVGRRGGKEAASDSTPTGTTLVPNVTIDFNNSGSINRAIPLILYNARLNEYDDLYKDTLKQYMVTEKKVPSKKELEDLYESRLSPQRRAINKFLKNLETNSLEEGIAQLNDFVTTWTSQDRGGSIHTNEGPQALKLAIITLNNKLFNLINSAHSIDIVRSPEVAKLNGWLEYLKQTDPITSKVVALFGGQGRDTLEDSKVLGLREKLYHLCYLQVTKNLDEEIRQREEQGYLPLIKIIKFLQKDTSRSFFKILYDQNNESLSELAILIGDYLTEIDAGTFLYILSQDKVNYKYLDPLTRDNKTEGGDSPAIALQKMGKTTYNKYLSIMRIVDALANQYTKEAKNIKKMRGFTSKEKKGKFEEIYTSLTQIGVGPIADYFRTISLDDPIREFLLRFYNANKSALKDIAIKLNKEKSNDLDKEHMKEYLQKIDESYKDLEVLLNEKRIFKQRVQELSKIVLTEEGVKPDKAETFVGTQLFTPR